MRMLTNLIRYLGPKGHMIQQKRLVGTAINQSSSDAEIEFKKRYQKFQEHYRKYDENVPYQPRIFFNGCIFL